MMKKQESIKISVEDYSKIKEIAEAKEKKYNKILSRAINNLYKITLGNRLKPTE